MSSVVWCGMCVVRCGDVSVCLCVCGCVWCAYVHYVVSVCGGDGVVGVGVCM